MAEKSKILIIGGTGYIGKFITEASLKAGHSTFVLVRESTISDPVKGKLVESFKISGANLVHGDLYDHESLVKAIKSVDVVISTVGHMQLADQTKIIAAIKDAGNVKKFYPSEFGVDVDRSRAVEPAKSAFAIKSQIRRTIAAEGIPHTIVSSNCFAGYFLTTLVQPGVFAPPPPRDKVTILGDGNIKGKYLDMYIFSLNPMMVAGRQNRAAPLPAVRCMMTKIEGSGAGAGDNGCSSLVGTSAFLGNNSNTAFFSSLLSPTWDSSCWRWWWCCCLAEADKRTSAGVVMVSAAQKNSMTTKVLPLICWTW